MDTKNNPYSIKNIWRIAYPIILGSLAQDIMTVVDTMFVGQLGATALGAAAIGGIFYLSMVMMGTGFGLGVQIIVARRFGEKALGEINRTLFHSLIILLSLALFLFVATKLFVPVFISGIVGSEGVAQLSTEFLNLRVWGFFAAFINIVYRSFYIGVARTKIISYTTIIMALVNMILDYCLIFGKYGFPEMGIRGAALASVIAEITALTVFTVYTLKSHKNKDFKLFRLERFDGNLMRRILSVSTPTMLQNFVAFFGWFLFFLFVERMGEMPLAISNIIRSLYIVFLVPIFGFASATNSLVSYSIGRGEYSSIKLIIRRSVLLAWFGIAILTSLGIIYPQAILGLFTKDAALIQQSIPTYYVVCAATIPLAFGIILFQALLGTGSTKTGLAIEIATILIYLAGTYIITSFSSQIHHVWSMEFFYGGALGISALIFFGIGKWKHNIRVV